MNARRRVRTTASRHLQRLRNSAASDEFLALNDETMAGMTEDDFRRLFRRSAVKRAKYAGLMRNFEAMRKYKK